MNTKILALGDSWFHYPQGLDKDGEPVGFWNKIGGFFGFRKKAVGNVIKYLVSKHKVPVFYREKTITQIFDATANPLASLDDTFGRCGEELMVMVFGYKRKYPSSRVHPRTWLDLLVERIANYSNDHEKFIILLSAGGNDMVDDNLVDFLSPAPDPVNPINVPAISEAINFKLKEAYLEIFERICTNFPTKKFHFLFHGYGYPPVNGRGVFTALENSSLEFLHGMSPGPWLSPALIDMQKYQRPLAEKIIGDFIDMFNEMLANLKSNQPNGSLHYIDLRGITDKINRDEGWCNEIHFDHSSYQKASKLFFDVIKTL